MAMKQHDVIAERELELRDGQGARTARIQILRPEVDGGRGAFRCAYRVMGLEDEPRERFAYGVDSVQALMLCIKRIGIDLLVLRRSYRLTWLGSDEDNLGFP